MKDTYTLNKGQLELLLELYKFRFGNRSLLAGSLGKQNNTSLYSRITILMKHGYIGSRFDKSYRLSGRGAEYFVSPKGLRALQTLSPPESLDAAIIKASYKDKTASLAFVDECLAIYQVHNQLQKLYTGLQLFTKRELNAYDYFPKPLPSGFISLKTKPETKRLFLEYIPADTPAFVVERRLRQYVTYYENDEWAVTDMPFPIILYVCGTNQLERRTRKQMIRALDRSDTDMSFYTTTTGALDNVTADAEVWTNVRDINKLVMLTTI